MKSVVDFLNHNRATRYAKNLRNRAHSRIYRAAGSRRAASFVEAIAEKRSSPHLCFTIAYNAPWCLEILLASWKRYDTGMSLMVADNSSSTQQRHEIEALCRSYDIPRIGLPRNLEWSPNRSHGMAMNWVYHNIVRALRPDIFGFIDHDCFAVRPYSLPDRLRGVSVFGMPSFSSKIPDAWTLWAGFCFYKFTEVAAFDLDFIHRVEFGLDTGGGNWPILYKSLRPEHCEHATGRPFDPHDPSCKGLHSIIEEAFIHIGGTAARSSGQRAVSDTIWDKHLGGVSGRRYTTV